MPRNLTHGSPLKLSRRGIEVAERLDAAKTANDELPTLLELVDENSTVFEIQKACFKHAYGTFFDSLEGELKEKNHVEAYKDAGDVENVLSVYGIAFRDAVFMKFNINTEG